MALSVNTSGSTATDGTEQTLATITSANIFQLSIDVSVLQGGTTPDIIEFKEYGKARTGDTERLLKTYTLVGAQTEALFQTVPRVSPHHVKYTMKRIQGTDRTYAWAVYQVQ